MSRRLRAATSAVAFALLTSSCVFLARVSVDSAEQQVLMHSYVLDVSENGRFVLFVSDGALVASDLNGLDDIYVRDLLAGITERVSVGNLGQEGDGDATTGSISNDGRYVAFESKAMNLVPGGAMGVEIYLRDRSAGTTTRVTDGNGPSQDPHISGDGDHVAFMSEADDLVAGDANGASDIFVWDRMANLITRRSVTAGGLEANGPSFDPSISETGMVVAFESDATNLVAGDTNAVRDVFVHFLPGLTQRVSVDASNVEANGMSRRAALSDNGFHIAFESLADNLVPVDTNNAGDVFVKGLGGAIEMLSVDGAGAQLPDAAELTSVTLSHNGSRVAMASDSRVYVRDRDAGTTTRVNDAAATDTRAAISADGRYVAFDLDAALVGGDTNGRFDVYLQAFPDPVPLAVAPPTAPRGQTTALTITGSGFADVDTIWTQLNPTTISYSDLVVVDDSTITVDVTITSDAKVGPIWVNLQSPDGGPGFGSGALGNCRCLTVVS